MSSERSVKDLSGPYTKRLVGANGFEPSTSWSRTRHLNPINALSGVAYGTRSVISPLSVVPNLYLPFAYMPSPIPRQVGWNVFARTIPFASAVPRTLGGSAPASLFSGPVQRSLTLQPARSPSRLSDPLHQRLQQSRCLHRCSDCYRVERTSSRAGIPPLWTSAFTAHQSCP